MKTRFESFTKDITSIYRSVQRIKDIEMSEFGLKGMHVMCLYFLHNSPEGLTSAQLCNKCLEDKAAISRSIAMLKEKGLVLESQNGEQKKYRNVIKLTKKGEQVANKESEMIENAVNAGGDGLTDSERENFYSSLSLISSNLKKYVKCLNEDCNE